MYSGELGLVLLRKEGFAVAWWALSEHWKKRERKRKAPRELYRFRSWNTTVALITLAIRSLRRPVGNLQRYRGLPMVALDPTMGKPLYPGCVAKLVERLMSPIQSAFLCNDGTNAVISASRTSRAGARAPRSEP